jgi:hypothetical protein
VAGVVLVVVALVSKRRAITRAEIGDGCYTGGGVPDMVRNDHRR